MVEERHAVTIGRDGSIRFIYSDEAAGLFELAAKVHVERASHVEPAVDGSGWTADMTPSGGPVLGPFPTRGDALASEVKWLQDNKGL